MSFSFVLDFIYKSLSFFAQFLKKKKLEISAFFTLILENQIFGLLNVLFFTLPLLLLLLHSRKRCSVMFIGHLWGVRGNWRLGDVVVELYHLHGADAVQHPHRRDDDLELDVGGRTSHNITSLVPNRDHSSATALDQLPDVSPRNWSTLGGNVKIPHIAEQFASIVFAEGLLFHSTNLQ